MVRKKQTITRLKGKENARLNEPTTKDSTLTATFGLAALDCFQMCQKTTILLQMHIEQEIQKLKKLSN